MYTLLLVDDEEDVIEVIERKVSWEQIGFHVVGHAGNGFKALEMMEDMQPDVVMTDIRMPYMDGLELCSNIRQRFPATKLLLFTGFDDFEYAKEAVHLEIEEYILKPLNLAEITEVFKKLKTKLDDELNEKKNTDILKQYYAASLPVLQSNFYTTLIEGRIPENELGRYMRDYKIVLEGPYYCCIIIHTSASQMPQGMDIRLLAVSVVRQILQICKSCNGSKGNCRNRTGVRKCTGAGELLSECEGGSILQGALWQQQGNKHDRG